MAVGENTYYGSIRPIKDGGAEKKIARDAYVVVAKNGRRDSAEGKPKATAMTSDWTSGNERCYDDHQLVYAESPLPLQLFISSLSDALSYASVDTTTGTDFKFNETGGPRGSSVLHVTPMGSTTKLIGSETSSTFKVRTVPLHPLKIFIFRRKNPSFSRVRVAVSSKFRPSVKVATAIARLRETRPIEVA